MNPSIDRECSALGNLFNQIINDMKNGTPLWEDLISKATKLHSCLRAAIVAISAYLETFQKIADAATNARGATKEIGTALTRICLRHKAVETRMKSFTSAIMDCLVMPLQEKLEDWNKSLNNLYKEHAKEYKKARTELKKRSTDTLKLQKKKARKSQMMHSQMTANPASSDPRTNTDAELTRLLESSTASVQEKRLSLEETEKKAVRAALLEERGRFCLLARFLKPVLDEEIAMLMELTHLQEVSEQLQRHAASPQHLPPASEQVITDIKGCDATQWSLATPPSSPSLSLGSRKSSMCSISSLNSSSSGSSKSHPSPSGYPWHRSLSQVTNPVSQNSTGSTTRPVSTWPGHTESTTTFDSPSQNVNERPHTISSAYEKGHQRPALSVYTFQSPDGGMCHSQPASPVSSQNYSPSNQQSPRSQIRKNSGTKPPVPSRCSSLERPSLPNKHDSPGSPRGKARLPLPAHLAKELTSHQHQQPMYVNMHELASLAASRAQELHHPNTQPVTSPPATVSTPSTEKTESGEKDGGSQTSESSLESSSGYGSQSTLPRSHSTQNQNENNWNTLSRRGSMQQTARGPPPPTRRVSAIMGGGNCGTASPANEPNDERVANTCDDSENLPPPPAFLLEGSSPNASPTPKRSVSVSETVRTLTELKHTPASPSLLRKVQNLSAVQNQTHDGLQVGRCIMEQRYATLRSSSQERGSVSSISTSGPSSATLGRRASGGSGIGQSFMAVLSAKLISSTSSVNSSNSAENSTNNSPKLGRKHSTDHTPGSIKGSRASSEFLETLNAKLAQQQQTLQAQGMSSRSASIRRVMGARVPIIDPVQVRDSLMDQIRRGTALRKTRGPINDRSAPKIF